MRLGKRQSLCTALPPSRQPLATRWVNPLECEHTEPSTGDAHQATTTGLSFYRKSTNTPTFTDGYHHWALIAEGLAYWTGSSIDPPGMIVPTPTPTPIPSTPTATDPLPTQLAPTAELLLATSRGVKSASEVRAELERAGYLGPWDGASMLAAYERAIATPTPRPTLIPTATATPVPTVDPALRARCVQFATVYTAEVLRYSTSGDGALALYEFTLDGCLTAALERGGIGVGC